MKLQDWNVYTHEEVNLLLKNSMVTSTHLQIQRVNHPWFRAPITSGPPSDQVLPKSSKHLSQLQAPQNGFAAHRTSIQPETRASGVSA